MEQEEILKDLINKFIIQSETENLKTKEFLINYNNYKIFCSFGKGVKSKVPWLAFLKSKYEIQRGIYPILMFYTELKKIVIAFGVSEEFTPNRNWTLKDNYLTIGEYFLNSEIIQKKYLESKVYKFYELEQINYDEIINDLSVVFEIYEKQ